MSSETKKHAFLAEGKELENREMYNVPLESLTADQNQPRKYFDDQAMDELVKSIEKHGVLQPVMFRCDDQENLIVISGERRFRAAQQAKMETIPAIYNDGGNNTEIALVENLLRENLNPIEEAEALGALKEEQGYKNVQISEAIGKAESTISEILSLNKLPDAIKDECRQNPNCTRRGLVEIAKADSEEEMLKLFEKYKSMELKSDGMRAGRQEAGSLSDAWKKKVDRFRNQIEKIDFSEFGEDRRDVETAFKGLKVVIDGVLPVAD